MFCAYTATLCSALRTGDITLQKHYKKVFFAGISNFKLQSKQPQHFKNNYDFNIFNI